MRDCPNCLVVIDGLVCHRCGYRDPAAGPEKPANVDPDRRRCSQWVNGALCPDQGTWTPNTMGPPDGRGPHPGPWFCSRHSDRQAPEGVVGRSGPTPAYLAATRAMGFGVPLAKQPHQVKPLDAESVLERAALQSEGTHVDQARTR